MRSAVDDLHDREEAHMLGVSVEALREARGVAQAARIAHAVAAGLSPTTGVGHHNDPPPSPPAAAPTARRRRPRRRKRWKTARKRR